MRKSNITTFRGLLILGLFFLLQPFAHAQFVCGSGGPVIVKYSPSLPDTWIISGKSINDVLWSGTITYDMNGCNLGRTASVVHVSNGGQPTGSKLLTTTGVDSGVAIRTAASATVTGLPAPCVAAAAAVNSNRVNVRICQNANAGTITFAGTKIVFNSVQFYVTNPNAGPSTLNYFETVNPSGGLTGPIAAVSTNVFTIFDWANNSMDLPTEALPSIDNLACTLAVSIKAVTLPPVFQGMLIPSGTTAAKTPFTVQLTNCGAGRAYIANAQWSFIAGATATNIKNTAANAATNVEVQILGPTNSPISNGTSTTLGTISAGGVYTATPHYAQYISSGVPSAGQVNADASYILTYR